MLLWIPLAVGSYFFSALSQTVDKVLVSTNRLSPLAYAFYTGLFSIFPLIVFAPVGFELIPFGIFFLAFLSGAALVVALYFLYSALSSGDASRAVPLVGGASPIFILIFSYIFSGEVISLEEFLALFLLIVGGVLLSLEFREKEARFNGRVVIFSLGAAFFFASSFFLSKELFKVLEEVSISRAPFFVGFFWGRFGSLVTAFFMLCIPGVWLKIREVSRTAERGSVSLFVINKVIAGGGFFLLNISIYFGPVSIINAMKGLEHFFVFILTAFATSFLPHALRESFDAHSVVVKLIGTTYIATALVLLIA